MGARGTQKHMQPAQSKKTFSAGDVIMRQGEEGDCAYIIEDGQVEILISKPDGSTQQVGTRGPGTIIGEMSIVDSAPRTATVKALKDCKMLEISREEFAQRLGTSDPVIRMITQVILTRYRDTLMRADILRDSLAYPPAEALEVSYTENLDVVESVKIANEFKDALRNDQLEMHYQPIVSLPDGEVLGFEALMRWIHPEQGFISPGLFIPIAEKSGLITEASKWALKESCAALGRIEKQVDSKEPLYMSVNFSSHDFVEQDFVQNILNIMKDADTDPSRLKLEITERLLIQQPDNAKAALDGCRAKGIGISIDDFGTGYSSLSYLYYFPIETLKIDQSFVRAMKKDQRSMELVKSIIGLCKNMGLGMIAEGVEDQDEAAILHKLGCTGAQGYHFARPMPEKDVIAKWGKFND